MKEIKSRTGYFLTQSDNNCENRIYITVVKGININENDWREATLEEKEEYYNKLLYDSIFDKFL